MQTKVAPYSVIKLLLLRLSYWPVQHSIQPLGENVSHVMPQNTIFNSLGQQGCMTIVLANWGGVWVDLSADPDKICFGQQGS